VIVVRFPTSPGGRKWIIVKSLKRLARALGVPVTELLE